MLAVRHVFGFDHFYRQRRAGSHTGSDEILREHLQGLLLQGRQDRAHANVSGRRAPQRGAGQLVPSPVHSSTERSAELHRQPPREATAAAGKSGPRSEDYIRGSDRADVRARSRGGRGV